MIPNDVIKRLKHELFSSEQKRIQDWIDKLSRKNQEAWNLPEGLGFLHNGAYYKPSWLGRGNWPKKALHSSLHDEMDAFIVDLGTLNNDSDFIGQAIFGLISNCNSMQDVRDALPECLVQLIPEWKNFSRTRDEAYTIVMNRRAYRDYQKVLPRMHVYAVAKLIY